MKPLQLAILISGRGTNMQALIEACNQPDFPANIVAVISNKPDAKGLERAAKAGLRTEIVDHKNYSSREAFDNALHRCIEQTGANFVCLAGFMRLLTPGFVNKWLGRIVNIHPSLLPDFKGAHAHRDVLAAGVKETGCTVHFVIPEMDAGPAITQRRVPVLPGDTLETLSARVLEQEHIAYPEALRLIVEGKAKL